MTFKQATATGTRLHLQLQQLYPLKTQKRLLQEQTTQGET